MPIALFWIEDLIEINKRQKNTLYTYKVYTIYIAKENQDISNTVLIKVRRI